ncbi:MAG: hypothetical protein V4635_01030 [Bacteroidota bacterium]
MLSEKEQKSDTIHFWTFITKNFRALAFYSFLGGLAAFIITIFVPNEYKSYGVIFPPSSTSIDNSIDFPNFGYDIEADRLIQILQSSEIRNAVTTKFNLVDYFEIDTLDAAWLDELTKKYYKNIKFERTPTMSVLLSARSKDPKMSADIINFIINSADQLREKIYKKNIITAYLNAKADYDSQKRMVDSVEIQLTQKLKQNKLSSLLFLMSDAQISFDMDKLSSVNSSESGAAIGSDIIAFKGMYEVLKEYKNRYIKIKKTYTNPIPKLYVINYSEPNYKKISPSFTINTAIGLLFSLLVATSVLLIKQNSDLK